MLLDCLKAFRGTVVFVSHDRGFMEALSSKTLELKASRREEPASSRLFYGNYAYYLDRIAREQAGEASVIESAPVITPDRVREKEKQRQTLIRRLERREAETLKELEDLENEKSRLEGELARPEVYSSGEKAKAVKLKLDETTAALEVKSHEWEAAAEELEKAKY
jgi:ATP-binding cassette subfamily F protein 3